jgi:Ni,Fe-hydrogenase III large subunit/Ni,Fe-hydrogenase III component G
MNVSPLGISSATLASPIPAQRCPVSSGQLLTACRLAWEQGGQLAALWASDERDRDRGFCVHVLLRDREGLTLLEHTLPDSAARYPDLSTIFPVANRMQRAAFDLVGTQCDTDDPRPWTWQAAWPIDQFPLRRDFAASPKWEPGEEDYPFVRVAGDGVHEIAVGPVHAGIIEPGHFRFQVVGEKVLRLEERLGYVHKGIDGLMRGAPLDKAAKLAGRVSGDSTVAYAIAFARAVEAALGLEPPPRAIYLRALMAELERLANHFGDIGAICNDASFSLMHAHCGILREHVLRVADAGFGHRLMMDCVVPGGVATDLAQDGLQSMPPLIRAIRRRFPELVEIYDRTASLQNRTITTGILTRELAHQYGAGGFVGRASGRAFDARKLPGYAPYGDLRFDMAVRQEGDVDARVWVRINEVSHSVALIEQLLERLPSGAIRAEPGRPTGGDAAEGIALVEGFRGDVLAWVRLAPDGKVTSCHLRDPSWFQWPLLEAAIEGNIVADFPLCNKSFNCSYSGHDL